MEVTSFIARDESNREIYLQIYCGTAAAAV